MAPQVKLRGRTFGYIQLVSRVRDGLVLMKIPNDSLSERANWVWKETLAIHRDAPETRIASSLSPIELFVGLFYGGVLSHYPDEPLHPDRDRLIVSKGHGSICLYPILADLGFFDPIELTRVCQKGGILGGIPDPIIPGYETVNGSLGHGLGVATGVAFALRAQSRPQSVFVLTGDGELHEGSCWEALMLAGHHKLDNLNLLVDNNQISMLGFTDDIISHGDLALKLDTFGWAVHEVDGHNAEATCDAMAQMKACRKGRPKALIARTVKGRGVPGTENEPLSHVINPKLEVIDRILSSDEGRRN